VSERENGVAAGRVRLVGQLAWPTLPSPQSSSRPTPTRRSIRDFRTVGFWYNASSGVCVRDPVRTQPLSRTNHNNKTEATEAARSQKQEQQQQQLKPNRVREREFERESSRKGSREREFEGVAKTTTTTTLVQTEH
jgi:hypothetical protein